MEKVGGRRGTMEVLIEIRDRLFHAWGLGRKKEREREKEEVL